MRYPNAYGTRVEHSLKYCQAQIETLCLILAVSVHRCEFLKRTYNIKYAALNSSKNHNGMNKPKRQQTFAKVVKICQNIAPKNLWIVCQSKAFL